MGYNPYRTAEGAKKYELVPSFMQKDKELIDQNKAKYMEAVPQYQRNP